nr:hypothetical protein CFP56_77253 [Quercus suber]
MPNDQQDTEERRQNTTLRMETSRRQEGMGQNQETGNFPIERNSDVSLTDVTTDGDRNFWEKNFQIQIQSQGNKEDTGKQENVGSQDRKEKEGWRESYVIEDYERSTDSNYWDPQVAKRAEQQRECHEVTFGAKSTSKATPFSLKQRSLLQLLKLCLTTRNMFDECS